MSRNFILSIIAALLLGGAIIAWLLLGGGAPKNIDLGNGVKVNANASLKNTVINREKDGKKLWEFTVGELQSDSKQQNFTLKNIKGKVFRSDGSYIEVIADTGNAVVNQNDFSLSGKVSVRAETGEELQADKVNYTQKNGLLRAEGKVRIKARGYTAVADKAETTTAFEKLKLQGSAKVERSGN